MIPGHQHTGGSDHGDVGVYLAGHSEPVLTLNKLLVGHILILLLRVDVSGPEEVIHIKVTVCTRKKGVTKPRRLFNKV